MKSRNIHIKTFYRVTLLVVFGALISLTLSLGLLAITCYREQDSPSAYIDPDSGWAWSRRSYFGGVRTRLDPFGSKITYTAGMGIPLLLHSFEFDRLSSLDDRKMPKDISTDSFNFIKQRTEKYHWLDNGGGFPFICFYLGYPADESPKTALVKSLADIRIDVGRFCMSIGFWVSLVIVLYYLRGLWQRRIIACRISRGQCPLCKYTLEKNASSGCPECGWGRDTASQ